MEQLNHLIKDASNEFQCHNFKTSLSLYVRCIEKCQQQKYPTYVLHNLKSSEAALRMILGELQIALNIVNDVLNENKQHWLCLLRRSQIYKKQTKFKKALKDLDVLSMYCPDNMQVAALKLQLRGLMVKPNNSSESQGQESEEVEDEEQLLQFSGLRKIDRTSCSIMVPNKKKGRQSRVTLSGDTSYFYETEPEPQNNNNQTRKSSFFTPKFIRSKLIEIDQDLQQEQVQDEKEKSKPPPKAISIIIKSNSANRTKSILKNRDSKLFINDKVQKLESRESILQFAEKLKNVDGKLVESDVNSLGSGGLKEVGFRKSIHMQSGFKPSKFNDSVTTSSPNAAKGKPLARKSCLKMPSNSSLKDEQSIPIPKGNKKNKRQSKFDRMSRNSIDGKMIKSDGNKLQDRVIEKENSKKDCISDSDDGSQHNIFGNRKMEIPQEVRQNLGIDDDDEVKVIPKAKKQRTQSILKKDSFVAPKKKKKKVSMYFTEENLQEQLKQKEEQKEQKKQRKPKKSVMFSPT